MTLVLMFIGITMQSRWPSVAVTITLAMSPAEYHADKMPPAAQPAARGFYPVTNTN